MKVKTQKGITLVALIITVVVLLILAAVAIAAINDTGIIAKTNNAATKFEEGKGKESNKLGNYEATINNYITGGNGGNGGDQEAGDEVTTDTPELQIGSYVGYDVSYTDMYSGTTYTSTNGWRYLGKNGNNHLLVSAGIPLSYYHYDLGSWSSSIESAAVAMLNDLENFEYNKYNALLYYGLERKRDMSC